MTAIIFDTETTGLDAPEIDSAAWLRVDDPNALNVLESSDQLYSPTKRIDLGAMAVHHIMDEDLRGCPPSAEFELPTETLYLIGHNVDFDWRAIGEPDVKRIDTLCLSRKLWPTADAHTQSALMYLLDRDNARERLREAHSAAADVQICRTILQHIVGKISVVSWENLWNESEAARVPDIMPFGKHKGKRVDDVPASYKSRYMGTKDPDPYMVKAMQR